MKNLKLLVIATLIMDFTTIFPKKNDFLTEEQQQQFNKQVAEYDKFIADLSADESVKLLDQFKNATYDAQNFMLQTKKYPYAVALPFLQDIADEFVTAPDRVRECAKFMFIYNNNLYNVKTEDELQDLIDRTDIKRCSECESILKIFVELNPEDPFRLQERFISND